VSGLRGVAEADGWSSDDGVVLINHAQFLAFPSLLFCASTLGIVVDLPLEGDADRCLTDDMMKSYLACIGATSFYRIAVEGGIALVIMTDDVFGVFTRLCALREIGCLTTEACVSTDGATMLLRAASARYGEWRFIITTKSNVTHLGSDVLTIKSFGSDRGECAILIQAEGNLAPVLASEVPFTDFLVSLVECRALHVTWFATFLSSTDGWDASDRGRTRHIELVDSRAAMEAILFIFTRRGLIVVN
jgi:hypothetical protein